MSTATLAGHRATEARVQLPQHGIWWASATLDEEVTLAGQVELVIADLSLTCAVVAGGPSKGRSIYRLVGGAGGWARSIDRKGLDNDAGVKLATVAQDAATAAGETLAGDIPETRLGPAWPRMTGPAFETLEQIAPRAWYVDELGLTRFGRRATTQLEVEATRGPLDPSRATVTLAAESIATILPGVVVDGIEAADVEHRVGGEGGLRSTIWGAGPGGGSALDEALQAAILRLFPWLRRGPGPWEFRVVTQDADRLSLQAVLSSLGMPDLSGVKVRPGVPGVRADLTLGSTVLVSFVNGDPGRPVATAFEDIDEEGFSPDLLELSQDDDNVPSSPLGRVVRYGDSVTFGSPGPGTLLIGLPAPFSRVSA